MNENFVINKVTRLLWRVEGMPENKDLTKVRKQKTERTENKHKNSKYYIRKIKLSYMLSNYYGWVEYPLKR